MKGAPYIAGGEQRIILEADKALPKAEQSVFVVAPLTVDELYQAVDRLVTAKFPTYLALVLSQLRRVENFPAGAAVAYPADKDLETRKLYVAQLGVAGVGALGDAILDQQFVKADGPEAD